MTLVRAATLAVNCKDCDERIVNDVKLATDLAAIALKSARDEHEVDNEKNEAKIAFLKVRLDKANAWYRSPMFVGSMVWLGTTLVYVLAIWGFSKLRTEVVLP